MVKSARVSIVALMVLAALAAGDCAIARRLYMQDIHVTPPDLTLSLLLMANVLVLSMTALIAQIRRGGKASPFLTGVVLVGAIGTVAIAVLPPFYPEPFCLYAEAVESAFDPEFTRVGSNIIRAAISDYVTVFTVGALEFAAPLLVLASLGGWFFQRNGLTLACQNRRDARAPASLSTDARA